MLWGVLLMGFSWSLYFPQVTTNHYMKASAEPHGLSSLSDRTPPVVCACCLGRGRGAQGAHIVYVDNLGILRLQQKPTSELLGSAVRALDGLGLMTHEREVFSGEAIAQGNSFDLDRCRSRVTDSRFSRLRQAAASALSVREMGRVWEIILGHCTFCSLQERGLLSCFSSVYTFSRKNYYTSTPLWTQATLEARHFYNSMFFLYLE